MVSALDSTISGSTYADPDIAACFSDEAEIEACLAFEIALAQAQEELAIIPGDSAGIIAKQLEQATVDIAALAEGFAKDGIIIPTLLASLRSQLPQEIASFLHYGVTSQDVIDSGLMLRLKTVCDHLLNKNRTLNDQLNSLAQQHRHTITIARTRNQNAAPTVFGLKLVNWLVPLQRQHARLENMLPQLLTLQLGGAVGTMSALGPNATELNALLAEKLQLHTTDSPWHVQRDSVVEFGNWLATTAGLVGKIGQDMLLLSQSEVGELRFKGSGKSSTLPNKNNPVLPEFLVALASYCQSQANTLSQTLLANNERDGVSMAIEHLTLAPLTCAAGASLSLASRAIDTMEVDTQAMDANIKRDQGRMLAEAASFALSSLMDKTAAAKLVADACSSSLSNGTHMIDELSTMVEAELDWNSLKDPGNALGQAQEIIDRALAQ